MPKYRVLVRVVCVDHYVVEAENEQKAIDEVYKHEGELDIDYSEYSHTMPVENWTVEPEEKTCPLCGMLPAQCRCKEPFEIKEY